MTPRETVLVLYGGRSAEHEISILSARFVVASLPADRYEALLVGIAPDGRWHLQDPARLARCRDARDASLDAAGAHVFVEPMPEGDRGLLHVEGASPRPFDIAFPVLHGPMGEDGTVQGLFELCALPYVGSGVAASALGMDKALQKQVLAASGLRIVPHRTLRSSDPKERAACEALGYPLFVKPANMGSSLGVSKVSNASELEEGLRHAFEFDTRAIVEKALIGAREIECSVLGNDDPEVSLPGEIVVEHRDGFYSYEAKYIDEGARLRVPAPVDDAERDAIGDAARRAFSALGCAGLARVDLFLTSEGVYLNEVNTMPGFTSISMYPMLWEASGLGATPLVARLLELAVERHRRRAALRTRR